jgi:hypothetical protein
MTARPIPDTWRCQHNGCRHQAYYDGRCYTHRVPDWTTLEAAAHGWPLPGHRCTGCERKTNET